MVYAMVLVRAPMPYNLGCRNILRSMSSTNDVTHRLNEKLEQLSDDQRRFEYEHQRVIGLTTIPHNAPKSAKIHAETQPWDGEEHFVETSRRMLEDSIKPLKISRKQRLSNARENALDYSYNKEEGPTHKERLKSESSKKKRRAFDVNGGAAISGLSSGGWIESIASQEIENAVARGQFDAIPRGPKAMDSRDGLIASSKNPQLDYTEYLMNNIIRKQGGAPPWIMKQQAVLRRIDLFREQIRSRLQERLVHRLAELSQYDLKRAVELVNKIDHHDSEWEETQALYHNECVNDINSQIRGYNLQAPTTARKGYLQVQKEIGRCYAEVTNGIEVALSKYMGAMHVPKADKNSLHSAVPPLESPEKHYGFRQLIRDLFN